MATALITGANRGIGLALARALVARGDRVIAACREPSTALEDSGADIREGIDVTDDAALQALARELGDTRIDLLIANAGVLSRQALGSIDAEALDAIRRQFEVNAIGPLITVQALLPKLAPGARIGLVSSRMGSMADNGSGGHYGYRMSKAALNAAGRSLAMDLRERGHPVAILHPGYVRTDMTGGGGDVEPEQAAAGLLARMDALTLATTGRFWHANGDELPW